MIPVQKLSAADAAVMETFVVPRYLSLFGDLALELLLAGDGARIAHIGCRTGYPDKLLYERVRGASIVGLDPSGSALELARNKAATLGDAAIEYREADVLPTDLEASSYSHTFALHPTGNTEERRELYNELSRLLYDGGQALVAMPVRGSFQELGDLLREYALKYDDGEFGKRVEAAMVARPTIETWSEELENAGLEDVDIEIRTTSLPFDSGRAFMEDPITRLMILPELRATIGVDDLDKPMDYLREAIDRYWSETQFELGLNIGCASARRIDV